MATIVRRRSVGLPMDSTMASSGYMKSPADPQFFPGGRRLGNFGRPQIKNTRRPSSSFNVPGLIILACLCTWLAVRYYSHQPASDAEIIPAYHEIQELLKEATRGLNGLFVVFVSIYNGETTRVHQGKSGASAFDAFSKAMDLHTTTQKTFPETSHSWMKIDVVDRVERIEQFDFSETFRSQVGDRTWYYGFALDWDANWAFLPEEVWANNLVDDKTNAFRWDNIMSYLIKKEKKENQDTMDWNLFSQIRDMESTTLKNGLDLFYTSSHFVDMSMSEHDIVPVYHGHRMFDEEDVTPGRLMQAANAVGDYLALSIQSDDDGKMEQGQMTYQYNPRTDQESDPSFRYNLPRHAGALYSMSRLLHHKKDPSLMHTIQLGLDWLINKHLRECHVPDGGQTMSVTKCIAQDVLDEEGAISKVTKLGINSLTLLAISEFVAASRNHYKSGEGQGRMDRYMGIARGLADFIQSNQRPDGSLTQVVILYPERESDKTFPRYYQGEATYALARFYTVSGLMGREQKSEWLDVAEAAALYAVEDQWEVPDTDFEDDHWLLYGMAELHRCGRRLKPRFVDFAMRVASVVATNQYTKNNGEHHSHTLDPLDWVGIPNELSNSAVSAAMKSEGLCAVYDVAIEYQMEESGLILDTVLNSALYQLKSQYGPELAMYMPNPRRILGGMRQGVDSLVMRNDYSQHNLSSFLCLAKLLEARQYLKEERD